MYESVAIPFLNNCLYLRLSIDLCTEGNFISSITLHGDYESVNSLRRVVDKIRLNRWRTKHLRSLVIGIRNGLS